VLTIFLLGVLAPQAELAPVQTRELRVLFVGNSYTYADDIPWLTKHLAALGKPPQPLEVEMLAPMGATLKNHWEAGTVLRKLREQKWDFVVLQEQSMVPIQSPETLYKYVRLFDVEVKKAGGRTVLFGTWPRREHPENLAALTNNYSAISRETGIIVAPVGATWGELLRLQPSLQLFHEDGSHPSPVGSYVAACVFYSLFFERSPIGLPRTLFATQANGAHPEAGELSKADAKLIQITAWRCVNQNQITGHDATKR
jgi:hypothetical protein